MVRFGIIGTNNITKTMLHAAEQVEGFELCAIYSRTTSKAEEFANQYNVHHTYTSLEELAKSKAIDAVYIASPNSFHVEQSVLMMDHGKHVLCEKPFASNSSEVQTMIDAAKRNSVTLMEAMKTTFLPNFQQIQQNMKRIGTIRRYAVQFSKYSSRYDAYRRGEVLNAFNPKFSNGSLMDLGIYGLYPMITLFGEPNNVRANAVMLSSGVDGEGSVVAIYSEMEAVVSHSKISTSYAPCEIQGEDGTIVFNHMGEPTEVKVHWRDGSTEDITVKTPLPPMAYEVQEFVSLVQKGEQESSVNTWERSLETSHVMEEARRQFGLVYEADQK
ncbi:Gfo/Idh/MocA family protein [Pontibacillus sp. HMF3514]|uniref:Gfo/Idh/MocA family protein n=1 Tax=Pontibacillus sp. HMF3514 TaxID=2692425 RepID=UPI00132047C6|nr:Gfo/Idh/MocA family oxidoreductase [Pontibacillus sp. HMF3514]QHE54405.1 Gfo/Idh/MocA family oxidoreductase [Pontibacillus sp. HMF3514]